MALIGHNKQKRYFNSLIANGMLGHAYLFSGPEMIGKKTFTLELAKNILGDKFSQNPDFKLIAPKIEDDESKIYIEDIRDLKKFVSLKTYGGGRRIVIFDDAHNLTSEAANAFLKVLEEPPIGSVIFLISSMPGLLPPTILSRCEEVRFVGANEKEMSNYLADLAYLPAGQAGRQAGKKIKQEDKEFLAKLAGGRIGLMERLISGDGILEAKKAVDDLRKLLNSGIYEKMDYAKKVHEKALRHGSGYEDYHRLVDYWLNWVSANVRNSPKNEKIVKELLSLSSIVSQPQFNHRLALENFLLNL
ncbi:MAG: AAA family ATPase [Candidatus Taylorbacteria bacterium]|nr:AAA family ATPase [Candidatus Taylorbacteria bacterium]